MQWRIYKVMLHTPNAVVELQDHGVHCRMMQSRNYLTMVQYQTVEVRG